MARAGAARTALMAASARSTLMKPSSLLSEPELDLESAHASLSLLSISSSSKRLISLESKSLSGGDVGEMVKKSATLAVKVMPSKVTSGEVGVRADVTVQVVRAGVDATRPPDMVRSTGVGGGLRAPVS